MTTAIEPTPITQHSHGASLQLLQVVATRGSEAVGTETAISAAFDRSPDDRLRVRFVLTERLDLGFLAFGAAGPIDQLDLWSLCVEMGSAFGAFRWRLNGTSGLRIASAELRADKPTKLVVESLLTPRSEDGSDDIEVAYFSESPARLVPTTQSSADHYPHITDSTRREFVAVYGGES